MDTNELRKAAKAVYLATDKSVADDLSKKLADAARIIDELRREPRWLEVEKTEKELEDIKDNFPCYTSENSYDVFVETYQLSSSQFVLLREIVGNGERIFSMVNFTIRFYLND